MRRRLVALAAALVLGGCSGLPAQTPIETGRAVGGRMDDAILVPPQGPVPGADPQEIVSGFLRASTAFDDDASVAQQFLTARGVAQWQPHGVVIYENTEQPTITVSGAQAKVSVPVSGRLDDEGHYADVAPGTRATLDLTLSRVGGQWRVDSGLQRFGAMMSRGEFARYGSFAVDYLSPSGDAVVSDRRWFLQGPGLVTRLARAVLEAPPAYLRGAVMSGVPDDTELVGSVAVDDSGTATVRLTEPASEGDERSRRTLWTRFTHTLEQARGVEGVQLMAGGTRLALNGLPDRPLTSTDLPATDVRLRADVGVIRTGTHLSTTRLADLGAGSAPGRPPAVALTLPTLATGWYRLALSADTTELAAVSGDDRDLARWRGTRHVVLPRVATALTRPAYDRLGFLWFGGRTAQGSRLFVLDAPSAEMRPVAPVPLAAPWLADRQIRAVEIADDGQRLVVVSVAQDGTNPRVEVAGIVRNGQTPVSLSAARELALGLGDAVDATWVDPDTIAVLGRRDGQSVRRVVLVPLNEPTQDLGAVPTGASITCFGGERNIVVVTTDHRVLLRSGAGFAAQLDSRELAVPGR